MEINKISLKDCCIYKLSDINKIGAEEALMSAVLGKAFIVGNSNRLLGSLSVDNNSKTCSIDALEPDFYIQANDINADEEINRKAVDIRFTPSGKNYAIIPIVDNNKAIKGAITYIDDEWQRLKASYIAKIEYMEDKKLSFDMWFKQNNIQKIAIWGLNEISLALANMLKNTSDKDVAGIYENIKLKPYIKLDYLNYETDINFINSMSGLFDMDIDLIIVTDWSMRHIIEMPLFKNKGIQMIYIETFLRSNDVLRYVNADIIKKFKQKMNSLGCGIFTVRVPMEIDMNKAGVNVTPGAKNSAMSFQDRINWIAKENEWAPDDPEVMVFNDERQAYGKKIKKINGTIGFADFKGKYINWLNMQRLVPNAPSSYQNSIYFVGPCIVASCLFPDNKTLAYDFQEKLIHSGLNYRVVILSSTNDADRYYYLRNLENQDIKEGDVVFLFDQTFRVSEWDIDLLPTFKKLYEKYGNEFYYDHPVHCGRKAHAEIAELLYDHIKQFTPPRKNVPENIFSSSEQNKKIKSSFSGNPQLKKYQQFISNEAIHTIPKIGSIVMNCNPFTLGHQYLVEYAASQVDYLYIFVVEEDKSYFSFNDRIELVKLGTAHLKNVKVLPSGQFIISSSTFSEYFDKANLSGSVIDTSLDVETFANEIAPFLNITVRFVGEEPLDPITAQYNQSMKSILPKYGIELCEIPRKKHEENVISASLVRKLLETQNWSEIKELVPESTYLFLQSKYKK